MGLQKMWFGIGHAVKEPLLGRSLGSLDDENFGG